MQLETAIQNNVTWYRAVLRAHGMPSAVEAHYWSSDAAVPLYYSNLVTLTAEGRTEQVARIRELVASPPKPVWSFKDSHATLGEAELGPLGLRVLFDASWYAIKPRGPDQGGFETSARFTAVSDADELRRWEAAWQFSSPAPDQITFPSGLLGDPEVTFLTAVHGTQPIGGAILNTSEGAVGLSNVFSLDEELTVPLQRDFARAGGALFPQRPVVGYGRATELAQLAPLDVADLGPLRIWISD